MRCKCGEGRVYDWDKGHEVCRRCKERPGECRCRPLWARQMGVRRTSARMRTYEDLLTSGDITPAGIAVLENLNAPRAAR